LLWAERLISHYLFVTGSSNDRQAFAAGYAYGTSNLGRLAHLRVHGSARVSSQGNVQWKFIARRFRERSLFNAGEPGCRISDHDPRGTKVSEGKATLNAFGSAWGSLELG
jgi:hypothetical protein